MDAVVIACCTDGMIQKISRYTKVRERCYSKGTEFVDAETGEIYRPEDYSRAEWDEIFGVHIPKPWELFRTELDVRMGDDPKGF